MTSTATLWCAALAMSALVQVASAGWAKQVADAKAHLDTEVRVLSTRLAQRRMAADLDAIATEMHTHLRDSGNRASLVVAEVYAKGPEFTKCSSALVSEKNQAFLTAYSSVAKCEIEAAKTLSALLLKAATAYHDIANSADLTHCHAGNHACLDKEVSARVAKLWAYEDKKVKLGEKTALNSAESCMHPAKVHVDDIVNRLTEDITECDQITATKFKPLPTNRGLRWKVAQTVWDHYTQGKH